LEELEAVRLLLILLHLAIALQLQKNKVTVSHGSLKSLQAQLFLSTLPLVTGSLYWPVNSQSLPAKGWGPL
jgi:uncharacterized membrane protein YGL010W